METLDEQKLEQLIVRYEQASFLVNRRINAMLRELMPEELTVDQLSVMRYLCTRGSCTSSELAEIFCVGKSSITAIINRLFDKQLIQRIPDHKDRRVVYLSLTEQGQQVSEEMKRKVHQLLTRYITQFDTQEGEVFVTTFEKLAQVLQEAAPSSGEA